MIIDKKCPYCSRWYRGEGFEGSCTSHCHLTRLYNEIHEDSYRKKAPPPSDVKLEGDYNDKHKKRIEKMNLKWLTREFDGKSKGNYKYVNAIETRALYGENRWLTKFKAVRK